MDDFAGKRVVVMGLGRFGGGVGAVRWLAAQGANVLITDLSPHDQLADSLAQIQDLIDSGAAEMRLGRHEEADFRAVDVVVVSPAVPRPWTNRFIESAVGAGARITTEIRLLAERLPNRARTIGVTGTAGKSTTTAMIAHILRSQCCERQRAVATAPNGGHDARPAAPSRIWLGGNIGGSLLPRVDEILPDDWVVLELSSAMLYWLSDWFVGRQDESGWSPHIGVLTNVMPNHLDWHGDMEHYRRCKSSLSAYQGASDLFIDGGKALPDMLAPAPAPLPGAHNGRNAHLAMLAASATGCDPVAAAESLATFTGLPHRLQLVAEAARHGNVIRAYNDSKCTTPEAAALAIQAIEESASSRTAAADAARKRPQPNHIHLIAGGYDKGVDLGPMVEAAARCRGVYTIGATGPRIAAGVRATGRRVHECETLESAVALAVQKIQPGEVALLSPGCASWDQFSNYEQRGERFTHLMRAALHLDTASDNLFRMPPEVDPEQKASENYPNKA